MGWTRAEILRATGGAVLWGRRERIFGAVVTNSREAKKGSVFVALEGERFDGHDFLVDALGRGARCFIVHKTPKDPRLKSETVVKVNDTLKALGDLAHRRRKMMAPKVLAITGSNGKTTTKEMVAAILERACVRGKALRGRVLKTEGNYNNLVGLPLTLLRLRGGEKVAVLELGTSRPGEIRRLTEISDPDVGLITSVAPAHLEGLRSLSGVAREKGALFSGMRRRGIAVVNLDDPVVRRLGERFEGKKITYGTSAKVSGADYRALPAGGMEFTLQVARERRRVRMGLSGEHNLSNALAAAAMAYSLGVDMDALKRGLQAVKPFPMRMEVQKWRGIGIINDAYNANPISMEAALKTLVELGREGEKIAVLGDMLELGNESRRSHLELGKKVAGYGMDGLYLLGKQAEYVKEGALRGGMDEGDIVLGKDHGEIARRLWRRVKRGDWLLFKGSRGMRMEKALASFKEME